MDSAVLTLAKSMLSYETKDLDKLFSSSENPALLLLSRYIPIGLMSNYVTAESLTYTSVAKGSEDYTVLLFVPNAKRYNIGDLITVEDDELHTKVYNGQYVVVCRDVLLNNITINYAYTVDESGTIVNNSLSNVEYCHAYLILYLLCTNAQSIVKGDVIYSSQQFGQGTMSPASIEQKSMLAKKYFDLAMSFVSNVRMLVV